MGVDGNPRRCIIYTLYGVWCVCDILSRIQLIIELILSFLLYSGNRYRDRDTGRRDFRDRNDDYRERSPPPYHGGG